MVKIKWNEDAILDMDEIAEYIAQDSEFYALIQLEKFFERVEILKGNMKAGKVVPEVGEEKVRELIEGNYRIIYEIKGVSTVEVLCIIHGMRLLKNHRKFKGE
jgi:plasmid stabilization system protein ParE